MNKTAQALVIMGVTGSGKSTVGSLLATRLGWAFYDGDDFHPAANVARMRAGIPLTDADRAPWLAALRSLIAQHLTRGESIVLACSALKGAYRAVLRVDERVRFVYLKGSPALIEERAQARTGHFMPAALVESQFAALEEPVDALAVDVDATPDAIVETICTQLGRDGAGPSSRQQAMPQ